MLYETFGRLVILAKFESKKSQQRLLKYKSVKINLKPKTLFFELRNEFHANG
jgi:hypothetical protein